MAHAGVRARRVDMGRPGPPSVPPQASTGTAEACLATPGAREQRVRVDGSGSVPDHPAPPQPKGYAPQDLRNARVR